MYSFNQCSSGGRRLDNAAEERICSQVLLKKFTEASERTGGRTSGGRRKKVIRFDVVVLSVVSSLFEGEMFTQFLHEVLTLSRELKEFCG